MKRSEMIEILKKAERKKRFDTLESLTAEEILDIVDENGS